MDLSGKRSFIGGGADRIAGLLCQRRTKKELEMGRGRPRLLCFGVADERNRDCVSGDHFHVCVARVRSTGQRGAGSICPPPDDTVPGAYRGLPGGALGRPEELCGNDGAAQSEDSRAYRAVVASVLWQDADLAGRIEPLL